MPDVFFSFQVFTSPSGAGRLIHSGWKVIPASKVNVEALKLKHMHPNFQIRIDLHEIEDLDFRMQEVTQ